MSPDAGFFAAFYAGPMQHPGLLWLAVAAAIAVCLFRPGLNDGLRRYCLGLGLLSLTDAWLTSNDIVGIGSLPPSLAGVVPLFFVLAGDFRYLVVVTAGTGEGGLQVERRSLLAAAALTAIVPVLTQVVMSTLPEAITGTRVMFLVYEVSFTLLALGLMRWHSSARSIPWIRSVSRFVVLYYGLWATADAIILATGSDLGYLLRVVPNVLYYGGLIAAIAVYASRRRSTPGYSP
jgi:hypothetical protein